jgi:hypothetical protein
MIFYIVHDILRDIFTGSKSTRFSKLSIVDELMTEKCQ